MRNNIKRKTSNDNSEAQISIHLPQEEKDRFTKFADARRCTQREAIALLIDNYEKFRRFYEDAIPISLVSYSESKYKGNSDVEKYRFYGTSLYEPDWTERIIGESLAEYLFEQGFYRGYSFELGRKANLRLRHKLNVYYSNIEQCYIVQECMEILQEGYYRDSDTQEEIYGYSPILEQQQCKLVRDFNDVIKHFSRFSSDEELKAIRRTIAVDRDFGAID